MRWIMRLTVGVVLLISCVRTGEVATDNPATPAALSAPFSLMIENGVLSLQAEDASLAAIMGEIGRQMHIDVKVHLPVEARITLAFVRLSLPEAIEQLRRYANVVYQTTSVQGDITHIIVFPQGGSTALDTSASDASDTTASQSFQFNFDPSKYLQERQ